jgi:hypothetical protein
MIAIGKQSARFTIESARFFDAEPFAGLEIMIQRRNLKRSINVKLLPVFAITALSLSATPRTAVQAELGHWSSPLIRQDGWQFKDLNKNGRLDS